MAYQGLQYKPIDFSSQMGDIGTNLARGLQDRQQLPWARSNWQGAPQGAAIGMNTRPMPPGMPQRPMQFPPGLSRQPTMPQQAQGMRPDLWSMITQRFR